ncbi:MAG: alpha/beta hydrolase [Ilumatobacter sp.]
MMKTAAASIAAASLMLASCGGGGSDDVVRVSDAASPLLEWSPCAEQLTGGAQKECATLVVPLDHAVPEGAMIDIAVARVVTEGDDRIGSLVFNPGGPGGSGIEFLDQVGAFIPDEVADRFDLVSFDPRGVGASTAIECEVDFDDNVTPLALGDDDGWDELLVESTELVQRCDDDSLELARFVGTNNAARDLDLLRDALGDEQLSYVGFSYGTRLGATYAELFPERVRALVLDAAVKPTDEFQELALGQAVGFDRALENFATACDADDDCVLRELGNTLDVLAALREEIAEVGSFPTDDAERVLTPGELDLGVITSLYSRSTWPLLAQALFVAETQQDGTLLQVLGDQLTGRRADGTYDNSQVANGFINCADDPDRFGSDRVRELAEEAAMQSVYFADVLRADTGCLDTPAPQDPLIIGPAAGAPPILVIGNSGDPATPFEWSLELAASLDSGVLFSVEAEGHTAYGTVECVFEPVNAYLIDLTVPAAGSSCSDNAEADFFVPAGTTEVELLVAIFDCLRDNGLDIPPIGTADILADPTGESFAEFLDPTDPDVEAAVGECIDEFLALQGG